MHALQTEGNHVIDAMIWLLLVVQVPDTDDMWTCPCDLAH